MIDSNGAGGAYNFGSMDELTKAAAERGVKLGLSYAGALLPAEAHALMQRGAKLVDVRTKPELLYVGRIPGSVAIFISASRWRSMRASFSAFNSRSRKSA